MTEVLRWIAIPGLPVASFLAGFLLTTYFKTVDGKGTRLSTAGLWVVAAILLALQLSNDPLIQPVWWQYGLLACAPALVGAIGGLLFVHRYGLTQVPESSNDEDNTQEEERRSPAQVETAAGQVSSLAHDLFWFVVFTLVLVICASTVISLIMEMTEQASALPSNPVIPVRLRLVLSGALLLLTGFGAYATGGLLMRRFRQRGDRKTP